MAQVAVVAAKYAVPYAISSARQQPVQPITISERDKQIKIIGYLTGGIVLLLLFVFVIGKLEFLTGKKNNTVSNSVIPIGNTALQSIASQHGYM